jgi:hypothetical protein
MVANLHDKKSESYVPIASDEGSNYNQWGIRTVPFTASVIEDIAAETVAVAAGAAGTTGVTCTIKAPMLDASRELIHEAFINPYRIMHDARMTQNATLGGDVSGFLATDKLPPTVLGYRIVPVEELSPEDLQFFKDNPEAAGHFRKDGQKTAPPQE